MAALQGPTGPGSADDRLRPYVAAKVYASGAGDALPNSAGNGSIVSPPSKAVTAGGAGNINVQFAASAQGAPSAPMTAIIPVAAGQKIDMAIIGIIDASTTATGITVFW